MSKCLFFITLFLNLNVWALQINGSNGYLDLPYKTDEIADLKNKFSLEARQLNASELYQIENLVGQEGKVFFLEESYPRSESLNILVIESTDISYAGALIQIDYSFLQGLICSKEEASSAACYGKKVNIHKVITRRNGQLQLTVLGNELLAKVFLSAPTFPYESKFGNTNNASFYFIIPGASKEEHRKIEVRGVPNTAFYVFTSLYFNLDNVFRYQNSQISVFPFKNKIILRGNK